MATEKIKYKTNVSEPSNQKYKNANESFSYSV